MCGIKSSLGKEVGSVRGQGRAAEGLARPDSACNLGPAAVRAFEAVSIARASVIVLVFELVRMFHDDDGVFNVKIVAVGKSFQSLASFVRSFVTDKPPYQSQ